MGSAPHLEAFLEAARYFIGLKEIGNSNRFSSNDPRGEEMLALAGYPGYHKAWCAVFVSACVTKAGAQAIITRSSSTGEIMRGTTKLGGTAIPGPHINGGESVIPQPGDLITFADSSNYGLSKGCHIGIVESVDDTQVHTIEGNSSNQCKRNSFKFDNSRINAYIRPDWAKLGDVVGGDDSTVVTEVTYGPLYNSKNDRHDMTLRQVCYLDSDYKLTNSGSNIAISVINYTTMLGTIYDQFAPAYTANVSINTANLNGNVKIAVDYFLAKGYSASSATAITGCLMVCTGINPLYSEKDNDGEYRYGIGGWKRDGISRLQYRSTSPTWNTDLSTQLDYLNYTLYVNYKSLVESIKSLSLDVDSAVNASVEIMNTYFPQFADDHRIESAKVLTRSTYEGLIITENQVVGNVNANLTDINGSPLTPQYSVDIPAGLPQKGIIDDYTSYSRWYYRWNSSSPQKKLAIIWGEQGFPCDRGIATIGGYYCCAVRPKFGRCGEVIVVSLANGVSFTGIICDEKGNDAGSEWGHVKDGGKISMVEWERVHTGADGKVIVARSLGSTKVDDRGDWSDWYGQPVVNITNYGKYVAVDWS